MPYDQGKTRWHFADFDDRPKPEAISLLQQQEYWRTPSPERTQLRPGHDVFIKTSILASLAEYYGPQSKENCIKQYSYGLLVHMLGGPETAWELWRNRKFSEGLRGMFVLDDLIAVCLHCDQVFHLTVSMNPHALLRYSCLKMHRWDKNQARNQKRRARGAASRQPRSLLHFALNVS